MSTQTTQEQWTESMLEDFTGVKRYIIKRMSALGRARDAEDVASELFIVASTRLDTFDPAKGKFQGWLIGIAKNLIQQQGSHSFKESLVGGFAAEDIHPRYVPVAQDVGEQVTQQLVSSEKLSHVMETLFSITDYREIVERSLVLIREYDGNVKKAAAQLGISCASLRHSYRHFQELAQLVDRSMAMYWERKTQGREAGPLSVRELLGCFPDTQDADHEWLRTVPMAVLRCGGWSVDKATLVREVGEVTGYSAITCRILINRCQQMYMIARSLAETGTL